MAPRSVYKSIGGHGRAGDMPAKAFELMALAGLGGDAGVQRKAGGLGKLCMVAVCFPDESVDEMMTLAQQEV